MKRHIDLKNHGIKSTSARAGVISTALLALAASVLLITPNAGAQAITWAAPQTIGTSGDLDISTAGEGICAFGMSHTPVTVNSVTFTEFDPSYNGGFVQNLSAPEQVVNGNAIFATSAHGDYYYNAFGGGAHAPFSTLSAGYQSLIGCAIGEDPGGADTWTLTFTNLVPGLQYQIELWANDSRAVTGPAGQTELLADTTGTNATGTLTIAVGSGAAGELGTYIIGTGDATAGGTMTVVITNGVAPEGGETLQLNAFQLRRLSPLPTAPNITVISPLSFETYAGNPALFQLQATVSGSTPFATQWQTDGGSGAAFSNIGATATNNAAATSTFNVNTAGLTAGAYQYRLVAANSVGTSTGAVVTVTVAALPPVPPQGVAWGPTLGISADTDISTNGTLICAFGMSPAPVTVNTVTFTSFDPTYTGGFVQNISIQPTNIVNGDAALFTTQVGDYYYNGFGASGNAPFSTLSANYQTLVSCGLGEDPGGIDTWTLTFTNLVPGLVYELELWANDSRQYSAGTTETLSDPTGTNAPGSLTIAVGSGSSGELGTYLIGRAHADTNGAITVLINNGADPNGGPTLQLNALQLRILSAGFPPTAINPVFSPAAGVYAGTPVTISVTSTGPPGVPSYAQWQTDGGTGGAFSDVGSSTTTIPLAVDTAGFAAGTYNYRVVITNVYGSVTSAVAALTIETPSAPIIGVISPSSFLTYVGNTTAFQLQATVTGSVPLTNQWQTDGGSGGAFANTGTASVSQGATTSALTVNAASLAASIYSYRLVSGNSVGSSTSSVVTVTIAGIPTAPEHGVAWGPAAGITGDSDVSTSGTGLYAFGMSRIPITVNGVTFTEFDPTYDSTVPGNFIQNISIQPTNIINGSVGLFTTAYGDYYYNAFGSPGNPPFSDLSTNYQNLLSYGIGEDSNPSSQLDTWTLTFTNLLPGTNYALQLWVNDSRGYFFGNTEVLADPTGTNATTSLTMEVGVGNAGELGTYAIGTAKADTNGTVSATLANGVTGPNAIVTMAISAFQLRQLGTATPVTLHISSADGQITVSWNGTGLLQSAPALAGPWTTVTDATSPHTVPASGSQQFYRLKIQ